MFSFCHVERSETSLPIGFSNEGGNGQRFFAPLRMTMMSVAYRKIIWLALTISLAGCATASRHHFAEASADWRTRTGQLLYRKASTTLIGEVFVRFSVSGDFELIFSKGPGLTLLTLRQDSNFAEVKGAIAGPGWSGPLDRAPQQLRSWLALRDKIIHAQDRQSIRHTSGAETFRFRF